ncbi:DUF2617 family protein [Gordonia crocea]|uniref:DUF2617 domain-containing protein n=1 Tax=Gordonia crocea TaxID=589162 RepID=A0A7I9UVS6_9ACTN|nr:DUF2617 family protein [Gordonia crocea]GED97245.1 hypothetical protein nbrc107697_12840 [Gordonia crocea]
MSDPLELGGAFVDTRAADLALSLDVDDQPALATRTARLGVFDIELRLLGASHQVVVNGAGGPLRETVACLPGVDPFLPAQWSRDDYAFRADVSTHNDEALTTLIKHLGHQIDAADRRSVGLIGCYPGRPLAVTAIRATLDLAQPVLRWETWHTYPQAGEIVYTTSTLSQSSGDRP